MIKYLFFDLDGTLAESKKLIPEKVLMELDRLSKKYKIFLVSGAELSRMLIQAPIKYPVFMSQNGNEVYEDNEIKWQNYMFNKIEARKHIGLLLKECNLKINDDMVDDRGSQISFSFVGHHAPLELKKKFDLDRKKRIDLLDKFCC